MAEASRTHQVPIEGGRLAVQATAASGAAGGAPVVLIHGGPGLSRGYMTPLERLGGDGRRIISYDQRGCGESIVSGDEPSDFDLDAQSADVDAVLDLVLTHDG